MSKELAQFFSRDLLLDTLREYWGTWAAGQSQGEHSIYPHDMLWDAHGLWGPLLFTSFILFSRSSSLSCTGLVTNMNTVPIVPIMLFQKHWNYHFVSYLNLRSYNYFCSSGDYSYFCFHLFWLVAITYLLWASNPPFYQPDWYTFFFRNAEVVKIAIFLHITESQSKLT